MNKLINHIIPIPLFLGLVYSHSVFADIFEPEGIRSGSTISYPFASLAFGHDDNVTSLEDDPQDSNFTILAAGFSMQILPASRRGVFELSVDAQSGEYEDSSDDDYTDSSVFIEYTDQPNDKHDFSLSAGVKQLHDPRTPQTLETRSSLDEYTDTSLEGGWQYGVSDGGDTDATVKVNVTERYYDSERSVNAGKDRTSTEIAGLLRFPIAPNTRFRASVGFTDFDYDNTDSRDSFETLFLAGAEWQASDITSLSAEIGFQDKDFDQDDEQDDSDDAWELAFTWAPEEFNTLRIASRKYYDESITDASYLRIRSIDLTWIYDWEDFLRTTLVVGNRIETSEFTGASDSEDDIDYYSLTLQYALRPTLQLTASVADNSISSDTVGNSSDKTVISAGIVAAF
jgi:hypothetical protein